MYLRNSGDNSQGGKKLQLRYRLRGPVYQIFTDQLMIDLALVLIPAIFLPLFFTFSQFMLVLFRVVRDAILLMFILEYFLKLYVADSRKAYATNPWHVIDLLIVILAATSLIPLIPLGGIGASPLLRLLRVTRIFAVTGRTVKRAIPTRPEEKVTPLVSRMKINILTDGRIIKDAAKEEIARYIGAPGHTWIDLQEVSEVDIDFISHTLKIPRVILVSKIIKESYPKIDFFKNITIISIRDSKLQSDGVDFKDIRILSNNLLVTWANNYIITISNDKSELFDLISDGLAVKNEDFIVRILYSIFSRKISDYEEIVRSMEQNIVALEELPVGQMHPFFEKSFYFKKEIQKIHGNLLHFKQVLVTIRTRKILPGLKDEYPSLFGILYDESVYLYETSDNIRENLISLIDLRINTVSVGLNRVMRILAVIASLGLIPSIISGLFGDNLIDSPYPVRLSEVFFLELSIMLLAAYAFYRRGWLR